MSEYFSRHSALRESITQKLWIASLSLAMTLIRQLVIANEVKQSDGR